MPSIVVRFHAAARELAGTRQTTLSVGGAAERGALLASLGEALPRLAPHLSRMRFAIDGDFVGDDFVLREGAEVDVMPPVAGGAGPLARIVEGPLSIDEAYDAVAHPGAGGVAIFVGVVRDHAEGKAVARLDYEHHEALAAKEMQRVLEGVLAELPGVRLAALHRVGSLAIGDRAVIVAASAAHRDEAFRACRAAIDRIKQTVPIWKHEWAPDGSAAWVGFDEPG